MNAVAERLGKGAARGLGAANAIAAEAVGDPKVLRHLLRAAGDVRPLVASRAANALKKVHAADPALLVPFSEMLLRTTLRCEVLEARWNLILVVGQLPLRGRDRALATDLMFEALGSQSAFLRVFALQGLADLATHDAALARRLRPVLAAALEDASAAVRARARKLAKGTVRA